MAFTFGVDILPSNDNSLTLGSTNKRWVIYGNLTGNAQTATSAGSATTAGTADKATSANISTSNNAIAAYSNTTGKFKQITTAKGAFYASSTNGAAGFGTLPVECGGTGVDSFTSGKLLIGNGTGPIGTKDITDLTSAGALGDSSNIATVNTIRYSRATINNAAQTGSTSIYAPTSAGTAGQFLKSGGGTNAPVWQTFSPALSLSTAGANAQSLTFTLFEGVTSTVTLATGATNQFGVVKLSDTSSKTTGAASGTAATPAGVWAAITSSDAQITIGNQDKVVGQEFNLETLRSDLGLSSAFIYRGTLTSLPEATNSSTWNDYTNGSVVIVTEGINAGVWVYNREATAAASKWDKLGDATTYKIMQQPYNSSNTSSSGNATTFISGITQDANGLIAVTKAAVPTASSSVAGITTVGAAGGAAAYNHSHGDDYLLKTGGTMTGTLKTKGLKGTENIDYGTLLPDTGTTGQVFFQLSGGSGAYELPSGGLTGQVLLKHSNTDRDVEWGEVSGIPSGGAAGQALVKNSATDGDVTWGAVGGIMEPVANTATTFYVTGSTSNLQNTDPAVFDDSIYITGSVLYGAAWNDYAEYRETTEEVEPGRCIIENGDGTLSLSTKRMQAGAEIVSDTFGFAIGETIKSKTPIAVSGRVLAYGDKPAKDFTIGAPVCSGANGTISEMTEEEARNYPWLVLGTVSSIPQEETWGAKEVKVNGRVWIRVR